MNNAELAILGLLAEKPRHGYELELLIQQRNMRDWADLALSTIYYTLKQLQKKAWVAARPGEPGQRGRTIYELTPAGSEAWNRAAVNAIATPRSGSDPMQIGLSVIPLLDPADVQYAMGMRRARLADILDTLRARLAGDPGMPPHVRTMFDLSLTLLQAEIDWLDRYLASPPQLPTIHNESPPGASA
jgi:DNA-binding PadR family transcriptional regulator